MKPVLLFLLLIGSNVTLADDAPGNASLLSLSDTRVEKVRDWIFTQNFPGKSVQQRRLAYQVSTCLSNPNGEALPSQPFKVSYLDEQGRTPSDEREAMYSSQTVVSDGKGCIAWLAYLAGHGDEAIPPQLKHVKISGIGLSRSTQLDFGIAPNGELAKFAVVGDIAISVFEELGHPSEHTFTQQEMEQMGQPQ